MPQKVCLVGLGPHAKRVYYKYIQHDVNKGNVIFSALVDIIAKKEDIDTFFNDKHIHPELIILDKNPNALTPKRISTRVKQQLDAIAFDAAIVATEPKAHKIYIDYFLKRGIPVLTDKPITAPVGLNYTINAAKKLYSDAYSLYLLQQKTSTPLYIQVQRREHEAYIFLFEECRKVIEEFGIPITYFDIYHSDGTWSMPEEYMSRENHPYKYGYGKIMHSGYHFIDIVAWIAQTNSYFSKNITIENATEILTPYNHFYQVNSKKFYNNHFHVTPRPPQKEKLGEVDSYSTFKFFSGDTMVTFGRLDMLQSGFSKRAWYTLPKDTYKGNGRLRHERISIHIGPLMNIQLHSYQSDEVGKTSREGVGGEDHLDMYIFRNSRIIGGEPFTYINFGEHISKTYKESEIYLGQNEISRNIIYHKFLKRESSNAEIHTQLLTNAIASTMYQSIINHRPIRFTTKPCHYYSK